DDRDAYAILRPRGLSVSRSHGVLSEPLGERLDDQVVDVSLALRCAGAQLVLQLVRHAQEHRAAVALDAARAAGGLERDREAGGEQADRDVVEVALASR